MSTQSFANAAPEAQTPGAFDAATLFIARCFLAQAFMEFGVRKFLHPEQIYGFITSYKIPFIPGELVYLAMPWQIVWGWTVFFGIQTRIGALALAFFCLVAPSIFWLGSLENLTRDYCVAGGFLVLFLTGAGGFSMDSLMKARGDEALRKPLPRLMERVTAPEWTSRLLLAARILIACPFLGDAVKKVVHFSAQTSMLEAGGLPGATIYLVIALELVCGFAIIFNYRARIAAAVLALWCLYPMLVLHNPQFGLLGGDLKAILTKIFVTNGGNVMTFEKDLGVLGALIATMWRGLSLEPARRR